MTIQYQEQKEYTIDGKKVWCSFVEDNTVWFHSSENKPLIDLDHYKLNRKTNKLYKLNEKFSSWDTVENTLKEYDVWASRATHSVSWDYSGTGQGD